MRIWMFVLGMLLAVFFSFPNLIALWLFAMVALYFLRNRHSIRPWFVPFVVLSAGFALGAINLHSLLSKQLPAQFDRTALWATFEVVSLVEVRERSSVFVAEIKDVTCDDDVCPKISGRTVRLSRYGRQEIIRAGDLWQGELLLKKNRGFVNPGGFDYQAWLLSQGVVATGYAKGPLAKVNSVENWAFQRQQLGDMVSQAAQINQFGRFWPALILADRSQISPQDWDVLQRTGTIHLFAISGLHIGLVAFCLHWLGVVLARVLAVIFAKHNSGVVFVTWVPAMLSCSGAFAYAALAGFSIPTTRALGAVIAVQIFRILGWRIPALNMFALVAIVVMLMDPLAPALPGFWLSFGAVFCLLWLSCQSKKSGWIKWVSIQVYLTLALTLPLVLFGQFASITAPVANLLAVPIISFAVVPMLLLSTLCLGVAPPLAEWGFQFVDQIFYFLWCYLEWLSGWDGALWWPGIELTSINLLLVVCGLVFTLSPFALRLRALGMILLCSVLFLPRQKLTGMEMTVLDVGQGLAVVVTIDGKTLVYDTGPRFSESFDAGKRILAPYLRQRGIKEFDLVVSHNDLDHSGGAQSLVQDFAATSIYSGERVVGIPDSRVKACLSGQAWQMGRAKVQVLWPKGKTGLDGNDTSCVLLISLITAGKHPITILLPGDVGSDVEEALLSELPENIHVLIASHHGSASSSSYRFVRYVSPDYVVYSSGHKNRYGHPHPKVSRRFQREGSIELHTGRDGAAVFHWKEDDLTVSRARQKYARPWYW